VDGPFPYASADWAVRGLTGHVVEGHALFGAAQRQLASDDPPRKMTAFEKVFGRRPNTVQTNATLSWPAFENLQRRKPRERARRAVQGRAAFGVSAGTEGRFFIQPEGYGTKIAK
jgi:hypothetical protein